jgi:hypothetical protein
MIKSATCKGVSSVALRAPSNTPLHDQCRIDYSILCRQIYALSDRRSQLQQPNRPTAVLAAKQSQFDFRIAAFGERQQTLLMKIFP